MYNLNLSADELRNIVHYDPNTGIFTSIIDRRTCYVGKKIGNMNSGYLEASIYGVRYKLHRLAWLYVYDKFPDEYLDHVNGDKVDNRICNLREATNQQNQYNTGISSQNTSGYKGVYFHKQTQKWRARIRINGKQKDLGLFESAYDAHLKYQEKAKELHGKFVKEVI